MSLKKNKRGNKGLTSIIVIIICFVDLYLLINFKYANQNLPLNNFNLFYIGNLLNFIFYALLILLLIINRFKQVSVHSSTLFLLAGLMTLFLLFGTASTKTTISLPDVYLFEHPIKMVLTGVLFIIYQFIQFVFIFVLLLKIFNVRESLLGKAIFGSLILVVLLLVFTVLYMFVKKSTPSNFDKNKTHKNVAVVLGAAVWSHNTPSPSLSSRAEKAYELYKNGYVDKIQLTGSNAPGELSEAEVAYRYLKAKGIDTSDVWLENKTTSTNEQIRFIKNHLLHKKGIDSVVIVSDRYHLVRVKEISAFYNIRVAVSASYFNLSLINRIYYELRESTGLVIFWFFAL